LTPRIGFVEPTNGPATPTIVWNWRIFFPFDLAAADPVPLAAADPVPIRPIVMIDPRTNTSHLFISRSSQTPSPYYSYVAGKMIHLDSRAAAADGSGHGRRETRSYNAYRFNAKRWDPTTGNYDMGFRNYSPGLNQFLSRDRPSATASTKTS